jgi:hypothetical protein
LQNTKFTAGKFCLWDTNAKGSLFHVFCLINFDKKQKVFILTLFNDDYQTVEFAQNQQLISPTPTTLSLTAQQVMSA